MIKKIFLFTLCCSFFACQNDFTQKKQSKFSNLDVGFEIETSDNPELRYENLQLFPIVADENFILKNEALADLRGLNKAMENKKFRIVEKKPYGRQDDMGAVNALTILNKTEEPVFLMAGDVVQGGNQDRIMAQDRVIEPHTITDVAVFCVEKNRWSPRNQEEGEEQEQASGKRAIAFSGYYNVASCQVRETVTQSKSQEKVWEKVATVTAVNNATTATGTYAGLEESKDYTQKRDAYLKYFDGKFEDSNNIIGVVAISGDKMLSTDIFAHPNIFKSQFPALIHSYITESISSGKRVEISDEQINRMSQSIKSGFKREGGANGIMTNYQGQFLHMTKF